MSRKRRRGNVNPLEHPVNSSSYSLDEFTAAGYGDTGALFVDERLIAEPVSIFEIVPDATQPRRVLPSSIRAAWDGDADSVPEMLMHWHDLIEHERGQAFDLTAHLNGEHEPADDDKISQSPLQEAFMTVVQLAATILRDGLTNPITITRHSGGYVIETGERRWLAYHLLNAVYGGSEWTKIPAREVPERSVWRQAAENNARNDLNAIGRARQLALLLMDLWSSDEKKPVAFEPLHTFDSERQFYTQAADLPTPYGKGEHILNAIGRARQLALLLMDLWSSDEKKPVAFEPLHTFDSERQFYIQAADLPTPYGKGEHILNALGAKNMSTLKRYRDLLSLPEDIWRDADDWNCPEGVLRTLIGLSHQDQRRKLDQWYAQNFANGKDSAPKRIKARDDTPRWQRLVESAFSPAAWKKMSARERRAAYNYVRALPMKLDEMGFDE